MKYMLQNKDLKGKWEDSGISFKLSKNVAEKRVKQLIADNRINPNLKYRLIKI